MAWWKKLLARKVASELAPRTVANGARLTEWELGQFREGHCPDCGSDLRDGPSGGLSVNMYCLGPACGSRYNDMGPFGVERITEAHPDRPLPEREQAYR